MLFGKSIRQRTKSKRNGYVRENRPSRALFAQVEQSVERRDGHWHVNKGLQEREKVEMLENGKVNWKSHDGVLLQELCCPNRSEESAGENQPTCTSLIRFAQPMMASLYFLTSRYKQLIQPSRWCCSLYVLIMH